MFKKFLSLVLVLCFIFLICSCGNNTKKAGSENNNSFNLSSETDSTKLLFNRLKKVTVTYDGETNIYNVVWNEANCDFEHYFNYPKDPTVNAKGLYNPETRVFSIKSEMEGEMFDLPVHEYNSDQKIIKVFNEDRPGEYWTVIYNIDNVPMWTNSENTKQELFTFDPEKRVISKQTGSSSSKNEDGTHTECRYYKEYTIDTLGNILKVNKSTYSHNGDGNYQKTDEIVDYEKYFYDNNGNIIRYECANRSNMIVEFEYYDDTIQHIWERILPISYIEIFDIYTTPFFWYL